MPKYLVQHVVDVTVDRKKFTKEWMKEFRHYLYDFHTIEQHEEHLAQLYARGLVDNTSFIEGYGKAEKMGIKFKTVDVQVEQDL